MVMGNKGMSYQMAEKFQARAVQGTENAAFGKMTNEGNQQK